MNTVSFWEKVDRSSGPDGCWPWRRRIGTNGYGKTNKKVGGGRRQTLAAHRLAYELAVGPIPARMYVCHHCDNPVCCNPAHLYAGTAKQNARDKWARGRALLKVSDAQVHEIVAAARDGQRPAALARIYGVSPTSVARYVRGQKRCCLQPRPT